MDVDDAITGAIDTLLATGEKIAEQRIVRPDAEPAHVYLVREKDGSLRKQLAEPAPRAHAAGDVRSLIEFVNNCRSLKDVGRTVIWYSVSGVAAVLGDSGDRRDRVSVKFTLHPLYLRLQSIASSRQAFSQRDFVRLLRIDLAGTQQRCPDLLPTVRAVKIVKNESGGAAMTKVGRESVGRQIESELSGAGQIPESVTLSVPVFDAPIDAGGEYAIECAVDVDVAAEKFQIIPLPGQLENAAQAAVDRIRNEIRDGIDKAAGKALAEVWVVRGSP